MIFSHCRQFKPTAKEEIKSALHLLEVSLILYIFNWLRHLKKNVGLLIPYRNRYLNKYKILIVWQTGETLSGTLPD